MTQPAERLDERIDRLDREQQQAYRAYNDALTALDRALETFRDPADAPPALDPAPLDQLTGRTNLVPDGPPPIDRSLKGRLRGLVWRIVGPPLDRQTQFNVAVVEELRRVALAHERTRAAAEDLRAVALHQARSRALLQTHLMLFLQQITALVDTQVRAHAARADVLSGGMNAIVREWMKRWESLAVREARGAESLTELRSSVAVAQQSALALKRDVERLLATGGVAGRAAASEMPAAQAAPDLNAFKYLGFEEAFRGPAEEISTRLAGYVPRFAGQTDVVDLGCGRGEFLELLRGAGVSARGVDTNDAMVEAARARSLDVTKADALGYLRALPDASLGGLFASQVVEHLPPDYLMSVLETARRKLRPGSVIVLETINPACWTAFFESFIRDWTHVKALHPDTLRYLLQVSGFSQVEIEFKSPIAESGRLQRVPHPQADTPPLAAAFAETFNDNVDKLNDRMFTFQDYAAIGHAS